MNRLLPFLLFTWCLAERVHRRDGRLNPEIAKQERWAQDAVAAKLAPEQLARVRSGDETVIRAGRKTLRKLVAAVDRGTWIRDVSSEALRDDGEGAANLTADFERAGRTRNEALEAANELAAALAEPRDTLEDVLEPVLLQRGLLSRTPRGRIATRRAYEHHGHPSPQKSPPGEPGSLPL
ncbi:MAG: hypothetical protein NVSMB1_01230 [Polyangiales bacterium]